MQKTLSSGGPIIHHLVKVYASLLIMLDDPEKDADLHLTYLKKARHAANKKNCRNIGTLLMVMLI
jgi:hypothetical protein